MIKAIISYFLLTSILCDAPSSCRQTKGFSMQNSKNSFLKPLHLWFLGLLVIPSVLLPSSLIVKHFLADGPFVLDSGWFAYLVSMSSWTMNNPPFIGESSYFSTHISPTFFVSSFFANALRLKPFVALAGWQIITCSSMAITAYLFLQKRLFTEPDKMQNFRTAAVVALLPLSGLSIAMLRYPHTEAMGISLGFLSLALVLSHQRVWQIFSWLILLLALGVREDVGFHLFGLSMTFLCLSVLKKSPPQQWKRILTLAVVSFFYSALVIIIQKIFYSEYSAFSRIYSGSPAWAHVNLEFIWERIKYIILHRGHWAWPFIATLIFALLRRNILLLTPVFAVTPWLFLNLFAFEQQAGTLVAYYAYPMLAIFSWPLLQNYLASDPQKERRVYVNFTLALLVISWISSDSLKNFSPLHLRHALNGSYEMRLCLADTYISKAGDNAAMDSSFAALFPERYSRQMIYVGAEETSNKDYVLLWYDSYAARVFTNSAISKNQFTKIAGDERTFSVWQNNAKPGGDIDWQILLQRCDLR